MYIKGFKIAISANFVILLLIGMMLTNVVITYFWQQYAVNQAVGYARVYLSLLASESAPRCDGDFAQTLFSAGISENGATTSATSLVKMENGTFFANEEFAENESDFAPVLKEAVHTQAEATGSSGNYLSLFGLSARDLIVAAPVKNCDNVEAIGMIVHLPAILRRVHSYQSAIWVYLLINVVILATLWFFRARRLVFAPLEKLVAMSESFGMAASDFIGPVSKKNEFGQLADALRNMLARIETDKEKLTQTVQSLEEANRQILENQQSLVEAEKFAAVGRLSAGLAHEIGNPLGIIQGYIELLGRDDISAEDRRQYTERAGKELNRVTTLIRQLLELARKKRDSRAVTRVSPVVHELVEILQQQKTTKDITFQITCDEFSEKVRCSEAELHQVLLNCILNSIDAINEQNVSEGIVSVSCAFSKEESQKTVKIEIYDNGGGIETSALSSIFDPFFTTKKIGQGTGLGLSVSRSIIENSGGEIRVHSEKERGTCVTIILPTA